MHLEDLLLGAFVYLTAAVVAAPLATRLGLGSVLGYLIAGIVIGPAVLGLVGSEGQDVMHFAEFGVIVMLFLVGLELQPSKLWALRKPILGLGGLQVVGTAAAIGLAAWALGLSWQTALAAGLILAMSSTAIVLQSLQERGLLKTSAGQSCFSVLLFQDIAVIPILALLPLIAVSHGSDDHGGSLIADLPAWAQAVMVLAAVAIIILAGRYLMRPLFRLVAGSGIREIFVAFALLIVVGITLLMQLVGLSAALGTFLAGVVLAESEYRHELEMDLDPFKGLLLAVFFMAVGAGIDFSLLASQPEPSSASFSASWRSSLLCSSPSPSCSACRHPMPRASPSRWRRAESSPSCSSPLRRDWGCSPPRNRACWSPWWRSPWRWRPS